MSTYLVKSYLLGLLEARNKVKRGHRVALSSGFQKDGTVKSVSMPQKDNRLCKNSWNWHLDITG